MAHRHDRFKGFLESKEYSLILLDFLKSHPATDKTSFAIEVDSTQQTINGLDKTAKDEKTTAVLGTVNNAITSIFGLFSSNSNRKLEEEKPANYKFNSKGNRMPICRNFYAKS